MCGIAGFIDPRGFSYVEANRLGHAMATALSIVGLMVWVFGLTRQLRSFKAAV